MELLTTPAKHASALEQALFVETNILNTRIGALQKINREYEAQVNALREYIKDNGTNPVLINIAEIFEIELTKEISGTATFEITWTATVPLDFDADDFEISFDAVSNSSEAEEFDFDETCIDIQLEDY